MEWGGVNSREPLLARSIEPQPLFYRFVKVSTLTFSFSFFPSNYIRASWRDLDALDLRCLWWDSRWAYTQVRVGQRATLGSITHSIHACLYSAAGKVPGLLHGGKPPSVRKTWIRAWTILYVSEDTSLTFEPISSRPWGPFQGSLYSLVSHSWTGRPADLFIV